MDRFSERAAAYRKGAKKRGKEAAESPPAAGSRKGGARAGSDSGSGASELEAVRELLKQTKHRSGAGGAGGTTRSESPGRGARGPVGGGGPDGASRAPRGERDKGRGQSDAAHRGEEGDEGRLKKAARFLVLLGKDQAAEVLKHLDEEEIEKLVGEIAKIDRIDSEEAEGLLAEFRGFIKTGTGARGGGPKTAKRMLAEAFGSERAEELYEQAERRHTGPLDFLNDLEDGQLSSLLRSESIPVQALVLSVVEPQKAAHVLSGLPNEQKPQLVTRIARMQRVDQSVLDRIGEALREKVRSQGRVVEEDVQGRGVLSQIVRNMSMKDGRDLLAEIAESDPDLAEQMRQELFTVDTVLDIEDRGLQEVLNGMDDYEIALVLKGKEEQFRAKILQNVSENRRRSISDNYAHMGPVSRSEADRASSDFLNHLRQLEEEGRLIVRSDDEEYI